MAKRFIVTRRATDGSRVVTEYVSAWDFTIVGDGVLVFNDRIRHTAFRDWISVKQES